MRIHIDGTPDVPDIVHPGNWIIPYPYAGPVMVVKVTKHKQGEWDAVPDAESWTISYLGMGYMTGEIVSFHDCGFVNQVVCVDGKLLPLHEDCNEGNFEIKIVSKPGHITVSKSATALLMRSAQLSFENLLEQ